VPHQQQQLVTLAAATGSSLRAVLREISTLAGLSHPHIVAFKGACLAPPHIAILEELAVGGSLHDALYGPPRRAGARRSGSSRGRRGKATRPSPQAEGAAAGGKGVGGGGGRLGLVAVLQVAADVAAAMAYLHPRVVHRDLKPQNVLLDGGGRAKV
jgi:serine/threonine protein kinase